MKPFPKDVSVLPLVVASVALVAPSAFAAEPVVAPQAAPEQAVATPAALATKTIWASGLRAPQGMARDRSGNVYVAEYSGGQIAKFNSAGKLLGKIGSELKSPAWITRIGDTLYVSERKANRLLKLDRNDKLTSVAGEVIEPLGIVPLTSKADSDLLVVAHTTSRIVKLSNGNRILPVYSAPSTSGKRYGYRCLAVDSDGSIFITDEVEGQVLILTPAGRLSVWATGLDDPTAIVVAPDGQIYVAEEGAGRVSRLNAEGVATVVADGLGQVRDIEFIDGRTFLTSDRKDGVIWQVKLPQEPAAGRRTKAGSNADAGLLAKQDMK